ncbi:Hpt domain-containing protein [Ascidiimonas sp. W6]|uniref:Hpt domain-containing protein n=1 Tax=Ascidiimonas meishanensis TaxID=3128903 RepID=UPI0030EBE55F
MTELPNLLYIESLAGDDNQFRTKLINVIQKEFPEEKRLYHSMRQENYLKETAEIVHKLKHKISILGLEKGYFIAEKYENSLKILTPDNNLQVEFETLLKRIEDFIVEL